MNKKHLFKAGFIGIFLVAAVVVSSMTACRSDGSVSRKMTSDGLVASWAQRWFGEHARALVIPGSPILEIVSGDTSVGLMYQTDQVPPVIKGKRGEIGVLVGVDLERNLKGIQPVKWSEDAKYFDKIEKEFFETFIGYNALDNPRVPDVVTGATLSSTAIIKDVTLSIDPVFERDEVKIIVKNAKAHAALED